MYFKVDCYLMAECNILDWSIIEQAMDIEYSKIERSNIKLLKMNNITFN